MNERRQASAPVLVALAIVGLVLASYGAGYYLLGTVHSGATPEHWCRIYEWQWLKVIYEPVAEVESAVTGQEIDTYWMPPYPQPGP